MEGNSTLAGNCEEEENLGSRKETEGRSVDLKDGRRENPR